MCIRDRYSQMIVVAVDYRLAPENKFPIPYKDAECALKSLEFLKSENCDFNNIIVCGDSAGGNLATVLSINSSKKLLPKIKGQILIYPWVDFTLSMRSSDFNLSGATLTGDTVGYFAKHYLNHNFQFLKTLEISERIQHLYMGLETYSLVLIYNQLQQQSFHYILKYTCTDNHVYPSYP